MERRTYLLGPRLAGCAAFVRPGSTAADIGTDHALLPIRLILDGVCKKVIAADIAAGPCETARQNIEKHGLSDRIEVRQCNGLSGFAAGEVSDIIIAGMGGDVMVSILESAGNLIYDTRLILQPMSRPSVLRQWLYENSFVILEERAVTDAARDYSIILAEHSDTPVTCSLIDIHLGKLDCKSGLAAKRLALKQAKILRSQSIGLRSDGDDEQAAQLEMIAELLEAKAKEC